jgi:protein-disulfide isomerase
MKLKNLFSSSKAVKEDGLRILSHTSMGLMIEETINGESLLKVIPANIPFTVESVLDGKHSRVVLTFKDGEDIVFGCSNETDCKAAYEQLRTALTRQQFSYRRTLGKIAVFGAVAAFVIFMFTPPGDPQIQGLTELQQPTPEAVQTASDKLKESRVTSTELLEIQASKGIELTKGAKPFTVFSDPNCPFCRELEKSFVTLDPNLKPVVLPLGFKTGARDLSAAILCSPDPALAWKEFMLTEKQPSAKACDAGFAQVDANMELFQRLKLTSTPTMVNSSGLIVVGSGTPEVIARVMSQ